jgi:antitoxin Phd
MKIYTYSEARQRLAKLLDQATREGAVRIRRRDGRTFIIRPERLNRSPLEVEGVDLGVTTNEIVDFIREGRREGWRPPN